MPKPDFPIENRVRRLRRIRGLTQRDLGALLGVSRQTINAIENGRYDPGLRLAFDIAQLFAMRIEDVFRPVRQGTGSTAWSDLMLPIPHRLSAGAVALRPHTPQDLPSFQRFATDPDSTRHMAFTAEQKTPDGAAALMAFVIDSYAGDMPVFSLTIAHAETDAYLGAAGAADAGGGRAEIYVTLLPEARGRGCAAEALGLLTRYLFERCGVTGLIADVVEDNRSARSLFERAGFVLAGPVDRASEDGELVHAAMAGVRYTLSPGEADLARLASETQDIYERNAARFDRERPKGLHERAWLDRFCALLPQRGRILDLGCGAGDPFYTYLTDAGYSVTGIDRADAMLTIAKARFPDGDWRRADMRVLDLSDRFDGILGWNSFFHLTQDEQRATLDRLGMHLKETGVLMLTVGPRAGEAVGRVGDDRIYHSSLSPDEYRARLADLGLRVVHFVAEDPACDRQTVLIARRESA